MITRLFYSNKHGSVTKHKLIFSLLQLHSQFFVFGGRVIQHKICRFPFPIHNLVPRYPLQHLKVLELHGFGENFGSDRANASFVLATATRLEKVILRRERDICKIMCYMVIKPLLREGVQLQIL